MPTTRRCVLTALILLMACAPSFGSAQELRVQSRSTSNCTLDPTEIYAETDRSVLKVLTLHIDPMVLMDRVQAGSGSAIALGGGFFATNYHVVGKAEEVMLVADEEFLPAVVIGRDPALDVAVLFSANDMFMGFSRQMPFSSKLSVLPGQQVFVIGYPLGAGRSISSGIVSAIERFLPLNTSAWTTRFIQTDAAISPGNSGGALINQCGELLGMVTLKNLAPGVENVGYALSLETLEPLVAEIIDTGRVSRAWHGIYGQMVTPLILSLLGADPTEEITGFLVETVEPGSAADKGGIRGGQVPVLWGLGEFVLGGDIITHVDGRRIVVIEDAVEIVDALTVGDRVTIDYLRDGLQASTSVVLEERPFFESDAFPLSRINR